MRQKVFGIGLSKTGTTSLYVALHALGYRAGTYGHLKKLGLDNWFYNDFRNDYLKEFDALTDLPIGCFFKELDERYPGSMFILTIRDKKQWLNSCRSFFTNRQNSDSFYCKTQKSTYGAVSFNEILYSRAYDSHMESVYTYFKNRPGDLLIMNITEGDGWELLCHFLGVSVPDEPFPNVKPGFRPEAKKQLQFHRQIRKIQQQITTRLRSMLNKKYRGVIQNYKAQFYRFSPKLMMWYIESQKENNCWNENQPICEDYALYPKRFYCAVQQYDNKKAYDYCFIGGYKTDFFTEKNRRWILDFITSNFTKDSYLKFTDSTTKQNYKALGDYDFTLSQDGFVPKERKVVDRNWFDEDYFKIMSKSKFTLCPAGDLIYSMRFYESLMCRSIPIVNSINETFRSEAESLLGYKYYLVTDDIEYREDWVNYNYELFLKYHTLEYKGNCV